MLNRVPVVIGATNMDDWAVAPLHAGDGEQRGGSLSKDVGRVDGNTILTVFCHLS